MAREKVIQLRVEGGILMEHPIEGAISAPWGSRCDWACVLQDEARLWLQKTSLGWYRDFDGGLVGQPIQMMALVQRPGDRKARETRACYVVLAISVDEHGDGHVLLGHARGPKTAIKHAAMWRQSEGIKI